MYSAASQIALLFVCHVLNFETHDWLLIKVTTDLDGLHAQKNSFLLIWNVASSTEST